MKTLTVFTPTYNRKHTLPRTYESLCRQTCRDFDWLVIDDGSSDGTREWIESLGPKIQAKGQRFDWMGRFLDGEDENHFVIQAPNIKIEYVYKPNGGLYTGYNVAYQTIQTELCVCIDSDDFMPDDAVEKIISLWRKHYPKGSMSTPISPLTQREYCGINGLDFDVRTKQPIGGYLPNDLKDGNLLILHHVGDKKQVMRTDMMRQIAPQIGYKGEKDFNPCYMLMQAFDKNPMLMLNENLCWVEYQVGLDSMSQGIWKQYKRSPHSYAKYRLLEMQLSHIAYSRKFISNIHYISSCILGKDSQCFHNSPMKFTTFLALPFGIVLNFIINFKNR